MKNAIFIGATGQNVGKTTLCLGILAGLKKRYSSVGFVKPLGQQYEMVDGTPIDKDAILFKEHFQLDSQWEDMSPIVVLPGFTRRFLDGEIEPDFLQKKITGSFQQISSASQFTVVEGTGHMGVGSILGWNNATVAKKLGADVILIASGGLGSAVDDLAKNIALCKQEGVTVRGVILNRVQEEKREMVLNYFPQALKPWNIPLIGAVPYNEFLSKPTIQDFAALFKTTLLSGQEHRYRHFHHLRLVASSLKAFQRNMPPNELVITPASREDIISAIIDKHEEAWKEKQTDLEGGMIVTGRLPPTEKILKKIQNARLPILYASLYSYKAMKKITSHIAKICTKDTRKVEKAIQLVEGAVDFEAFS